MDIAEFNAARRNEEEAIAREAAGLTECWVAEEPAIGVVLVDGEPLIEGHITGLTAHIARHDPARALRDVAAARLVLAEHLPIESIYGLTCKRCVSWVDAPLPDGGETEFGIAIPDPWPCLPVRAILVRWADYPDYNPDWAPEGTG